MIKEQLVKKKRSHPMNKNGGKTVRLNLIFPATCHGEVHSSHMTTHYSVNGIAKLLEAANKAYIRQDSGPILNLVQRNARLVFYNLATMDFESVRNSTLIT